mmetsp:Transcript_8954/g.30581  ORF Transcript_8954/g.30581 Transcript_8954/m.30581 type:complete len:212 (+) Transcript_8954:263-898(+)
MRPRLHAPHDGNDLTLRWSASLHWPGGRCAGAARPSPASRHLRANWRASFVTGDSCLSRAVYPRRRSLRRNVDDVGGAHARSGLSCCAGIVAERDPHVAKGIESGGQLLVESVEVQRGLHQQAELAWEAKAVPVGHLHNVNDKPRHLLRVHRHLGRHRIVRHAHADLGLDAHDAIHHCLNVLRKSVEVHVAVLRCAHLHESLRHGAVVFAD